MRTISLHKFVEPFSDHEMSVLFRRGFEHIKPGMTLKALKRASPIPIGESPNVLGYIKVLSNTPTRFCDLDEADIERAGCKGMSVDEFREHLMKVLHAKRPEYPVSRIEFEYV